MPCGVLLAQIPILPYAYWVQDRVQGVASSNPAVPTNEIIGLMSSPAEVRWQLADLQLLGEVDLAATSGVDAAKRLHCEVDECPAVRGLAEAAGLQGDQCPAPARTASTVASASATPSPAPTISAPSRANSRAALRSILPPVPHDDDDLAGQFVRHDCLPFSRGAGPRREGRVRVHGFGLRLVAGLHWWCGRSSSPTSGHGGAWPRSRTRSRCLHPQ
jgi:hypothetical protein